MMLHALKSTPAPAASADLGANALELVGIAKSFGAVRALKGVSFACRPGEIHVLMGENGAGKSTLMRIIAGVWRPDAGTILVRGEKVAITGPRRSQDLGIAMVYQDTRLVPDLDVAQNIWLAREPGGGVLVDRAAMERGAAAILDRLGVATMPLATPVRDLSVAERQIVEIVRALTGQPSVLILDEPTSALTEDEERILLAAVRRVTARGVGVIYVTHRLNEVFRIADRVTVFRDGRNAGHFKTSETTMREVVAAIVGPEHALAAAKETGLSGRSGNDAGGPARPPVLALHGVSNDRLHGVDLEVQHGEIHGLAGLVGSGRTEILEAIFGIRPPRMGTITLDGMALECRTPADAIARGIALVPEDRHLQGLVLDHSIARNLTLPHLPRFSRWGWLRRRAAAAQAGEDMRRLAVKAPGPATPVRSLSGGNQQKVVFAKWNTPRPSLLLLDEPTVGVDVGAREEIYGLVRTAAAAGTGVLVVSSDLAELLLLCDRLSIVVEGRVVRTLPCGSAGKTEDLHHLIQTLQPASAEAA